MVGKNPRDRLRGDGAHDFLSLDQAFGSGDEAAVRPASPDNGAVGAGTTSPTATSGADSVWYSVDPNFAPLEPSDYVTFGGKWGASATFGTTGGTVTWSIAAAGLTNLTGSTFFTGSTVALSSFLPTGYVAQISAAFDAWAQVANINFVQVSDGGGNFGVGTTANIRIGGGYIDGYSASGSVVGRAFRPPAGTAAANGRDGDLVFDSGDAGHWTDALVYATALHEIGHSLGLDHSPQGNPTAIMNPTLHVGLSLQADDIAGIRAIYGARPAPTDDYADTAATTGVVSVNGSATGTINFLGDHDWFRVSLLATHTYRFELSAAGASVGTLLDGYLSLRDGGGTYINFNNDDGPGSDARFESYIFATGNYYLDAMSFGNGGTGTYRVTVTDLTAAVDDYLATTATTGAVAVNGSAGGTIETSADHDWFRVNLVAGRTYTITVAGAETAIGTLYDPIISLRNSAATVLGSDDDSGPGLDSLLVYTATSTGTYYIDVGSYLSAYTGTYRVSISQTSQANTPPVTTINDITQNAASHTQLSARISYSDAQNNPATQYQFWDQTAAGGSSRLWIQGLGYQQAGVSITVAAADLSKVWVGGASAAGVDTMYVRAFDGADWSAWDMFTVTATNAAPVATINNIAQHATSYTQLAGRISYSDSDGNTATHYQFVDQTTAGGSSRLWIQDLGYQQSGATITVAAADLSDIWVGGASAVGTDTMYVRAFDGIDWSAWDTFTITATNTAPIAFISDKVVHTTAWTQASNWLTYGDANGDPAMQYQFVDKSGAAGSAQIWTAAGMLAADATLTVAAAQLAGVWIGGATVAGVSDQMWVRAFDGMNWGAWDAFTVTSTNSAPSATIANQSVAAYKFGQVGNWLSYSDADSDAATHFQFVDSGTASGSARIWSQSAGYHAAGPTPLTINAAELSTVWIGGGSTLGAETMWVRAFDGVSWSAWDQFTFNTTINHAPIAAIGNNSLARNTYTQVQNWMSYSDAEGDAATMYQFVDQGTGANSGKLYADGVGFHAAGPAPLTVAATDLSTVWVGGATVTGTDAMWVRAFDGHTWSQWDPFSLTTV